LLEQRLPLRRFVRVDTPFAPLYCHAVDIESFVIRTHASSVGQEHPRSCPSRTSAIPRPRPSTITNDHEHDQVFANRDRSFGSALGR
jgi:hypothetical protein